MRESGLSDPADGGDSPSAAPLWICLRRHALLVAGAFGLFVAGFFLFYGHEAAVSGSWRYLITHDDEYLHWAMARAVGQDPRSDGHAFFYEERGRSNPFLTNATIVTAGWIAQATGIPVFWLYPLWKILMPFVTWLSFWLCLVRLWRRPPAASAAVALLVLLSTLFLHGSSQFTLFRFPRPGDALWLAAIWSCLALAPGPLHPRRLRLLVAVALGVLVLTPYYALLGLWLLAFRCLWEWFVHRDRRTAAGYGLGALVTAVPAAVDFWLLLGYAQDNRWLSLVLNMGLEPSREVDWVPLLVGLGTAALVLGVRRLCGTDLTCVDGAVLALMWVEGLLANTSLVLGQDHQMSTHRYYLYPLQLTALTGWVVDNLPALRRRLGARWRPLLAGLGIVGGGLTLIPQTNWFRYLPGDEPTHFIRDNSGILAALLPLLVVVVAAADRWRGALRPALSVTLIAAVAAAGYGLRPSQLRGFNEDIPFTGAYRWMEEHARPWEVVLTVPPERSHVDYLVIHTDLKPYHNLLGRRFSTDPARDDYRRHFYLALVQGLLDEHWMVQRKTVGQKLALLRLDYVLIEVPGEIGTVVRRQLEGYTTQVYIDERCVLLRVHPEGVVPAD